MTVNMAELGKSIEPSARDHAPREVEAIYSIAISLRRIADELAVNAPDSTKTTLGDLVQAIADRMIP